MAPKVDQDVASMRDQIERDEENRDKGIVEDDRDNVEEDEGEGEGEGAEVEEHEDSLGHKVAGV